jgi:hypothetical protein
MDKAAEKTNARKQDEGEHGKDAADQARHRQRRAGAR